MTSAVRGSTDIAFTKKIKKRQDGLFRYAAATAQSLNSASIVIGVSPDELQRWRSDRTFCDREAVFNALAHTSTDFARATAIEALTSILSSTESTDLRKTQAAKVLMDALNNEKAVSIDERVVDQLVGNNQAKTRLLNPFTEEDIAPLMNDPETLLTETAENEAK